MKCLTAILCASTLIGCAPRDDDHETPAEEVSLYDAHDGLNLPPEMQRELGVALLTVTDTNTVPESAIIHGAKEDFTYVKDGKHFVRTPLSELSIGAQVVTHGVKDMWRIELLALRGGEPCCR
jgi:hypothetical protein